MAEHTDSRIDSIVFDCAHPASLARFWCEVLTDYEIAPYTEADIAGLKAMGIDDVEDDPSVILITKDSGGARKAALEICFQMVPERRTTKNRVHLDVKLRDRAHLERLLELGATVVREWEDGGGCWMADPEGNDFCVYVP